jgi:hypothetical protein
MIRVAPSASFYAYTSPTASGLVGDISVQILDGTSVEVAETTSGITETPAGSGIYAAHLTAPAEPGRYLIVWDDGAGTLADEDLLVTGEDPDDQPITVQAQGPPLPAGPILNLIRGDDYRAADDRSFIFYADAGWPSIDAATVTLLLSGPTPGITVAVTGEVLDADGEVQQIGVEITAAQTSSLERGEGRYVLSAAKSGRALTLARGFVRVHDRP